MDIFLRGSKCYLYRHKNGSLARKENSVSRQHLESIYVMVLLLDPAACSELQWKAQWWIASVLPSPLELPPGGILHIRKRRSQSLSGI